MLDHSRRRRQRLCRFSYFIAMAGLLGVILPVTLPGQDSLLVSVDKLKTPSSPAFVLLGVEPTSVERPSTPAGFATTVLNRTNNFINLPTDFTLQVSPFWLFGHPDLTWRDDSSRSVGEALMRTATISVASVELGTVPKA